MSVTKITRDALQGLTSAVQANEKLTDMGPPKDTYVSPAPDDESVVKDILVAIGFLAGPWIGAYVTRRHFQKKNEMLPRDTNGRLLTPEWFVYDWRHPPKGDKYVVDYSHVEYNRINNLMVELDILLDKWLGKRGVPRLISYAIATRHERALQRIHDKYYNDETIPQNDALFGFKVMRAAIEPYANAIAGILQEDMKLNERPSPNGELVGRAMDALAADLFYRRVLERTRRGGPFDPKEAMKNAEGIWGRMQGFYGTQVRLPVLTRQLANILEFEIEYNETKGNPVSAAMRLQLAEYLLELRDWDKVMPAYLKAIDAAINNNKDMDTVVSKMLEGIRNLYDDLPRLKAYELAIRTLEEKRRYDMAIKVLLGRGRYLSDTRDWNPHEGIRAAERLGEGIKSLDKALYLAVDEVGNQQLVREVLKERAAVYARAFEEKDGETAIQMAASEKNLLRDRGQKARAYLRLGDALAVFQDGFSGDTMMSYQEALRLGEESGEVTGLDVMASLDKVLNLIWRGSPEEQAKVYLEAAEMFERNKDNLYQVFSLDAAARAYEKAGKKEEARDIYQRMLNMGAEANKFIGKDLARLYAIFGVASSRFGYHDAAAFFYDQLLKMSPKQVDPVDLARARPGAIAALAASGRLVDAVKMLLSAPEAERRPETIKTPVGEWLEKRLNEWLTQNHPELSQNERMAIRNRASLWARIDFLGEYLWTELFGGEPVTQVELDELADRIIKEAVERATRKEGEPVKAESVKVDLQKVLGRIKEALENGDVERAEGIILRTAEFFRGRRAKPPYAKAYYEFAKGLMEMPGLSSDLRRWRAGIAFDAYLSLHGVVVTAHPGDQGAINFESYVELFALEKQALEGSRAAMIHDLTMQIADTIDPNNQLSADERLNSAEKALGRVLPMIESILSQPGTKNVVEEYSKFRKLNGIRILMNRQGAAGETFSEPEVWYLKKWEQHKAEQLAKAKGNQRGPDRPSVSDAVELEKARARANESPEKARKKGTEGEGLKGPKTRGRM